MSLSGRFVALAIILTQPLLASPISSNVNVTKRDAGYGFTPGTVSFASSNSPETQAPILSLDGGVNYFFQSDGNLVVTQNGNLVWASYAYGSCANGACHLTFQGDGNLVATDGSGHAFWTTGTNAYPGHSYAANQLYFGSSFPWIQLYDQNTYQLWQTAQNSGSISSNPDAEAETSLGYVTGESFPSASAPIAKLKGGILFSFQDDGNIVVHQEGSGQVYWSSGTTGRNCASGRCSLAFQAGGDLAALDNNYSPPVRFWHTGTTRAGTAYYSDANGLFFSNHEPWISLYEDSYLLWETQGTSGSRKFDPDAPEASPPPNPAGPPCTPVTCGSPP